MPAQKKKSTSIVAEEGNDAAEEPETQRKATENTFEKNGDHPRQAVLPGSASRSASITSSISRASSAPFCRICHEGDANKPLISPCYCKGSLAYCHASCLQTWLASRVENRQTWTTACEICKSAYEIRYRYEHVGPRDCSPCRRNHPPFVVFAYTFIFCFIGFICLGSSQYGHEYGWRIFAIVFLAIVFFGLSCLLFAFLIAIWDDVKEWWNSNLSPVIMDQNIVAIGAESPNAVEKPTHLSDEETEAEIVEEANDKGSDVGAMEMGESITHG